ncbi:hypothetical protein JYU34_019313 [Plutella xylostella]|uniref:Regulatory protein zeste n=1 Tax=Plutella xylostella TaxID=51655 RepID=A0ABQ7PWI7_PLUXY|nr:hypothetical protein JYU34_019313 [Plutella xylostella]
MERKPRQIRRKNRSANWIPAEKILLRKLVRPHLSIIENKRTDSETNQKKREAWNALCNSFNELSTIGIPRTVVNLKTQWCIMKMEQKRKRLAATWIIKRERPDTSTETLISIKQEKPDSSDETVLSEDLSIRKDVEVNSNRGPGPSQAALDYQMHNERKREELLNIQIKNEKTKMMILEHQLIYWKKRSSALDS